MKILNISFTQAKGGELVIDTMVSSNAALTIQQLYNLELVMIQLLRIMKH